MKEESFHNAPVAQNNYTISNDQSLQIFEGEGVEELKTFRLLGNKKIGAGAQGEVFMV